MIIGEWSLFKSTTYNVLPVPEATGIRIMDFLSSLLISVVINVDTSC